MSKITHLHKRNIVNMYWELIWMGVNAVCTRWLHLNVWCSVVNPWVSKGMSVHGRHFCLTAQLSSQSHSHLCPQLITWSRTLFAIAHVGDSLPAYLDGRCFSHINNAMFIRRTLCLSHAWLISTVSWSINLWTFLIQFTKPHEPDLVPPSTSSSYL